MYRNYILCLLLLLVAAGLNAQSHKWQPPIDSGKIYLRANLLGLIDFLDGNITLGGEARLSRRLSVTMDAGYIFYSLYYGQPYQATGTILRPGIRWYWGKHKKLFCDLHLQYKGVGYRVNGWLQKDLVNNVGTYEERKLFQARKRVYGGQIILGNRLISFNNNRWSTEMYWGLGIRYKEEWLYHEEPNSGYITEPNMLIRQSVYSTRKNSQILPSMPFGFRLVYAIK